MPGLEIGVPIELLAFETRFHVGPGLMHIDFRSQYLPRNMNQTRIAGQPAQHIAKFVHPEYRPDGIAARLGNSFFQTHNRRIRARSEEHTSELQSLMRISYAVFCLKKKTTNNRNTEMNHRIITPTN